MQYLILLPAVPSFFLIEDKDLANKEEARGEAVVATEGAAETVEARAVEVAVDMDFPTIVRIRVCRSGPQHRLC